MGNRRRIVFVTTILAALGAYAFLLFHHPATLDLDPIYNGKPLSFWLREGADPVISGKLTRVQNANEAFNSAGTNAIPVLLKLLRAHDSPLKLKLIALAQKQSLITVHHVPAQILHLEAMNRFLRIKTTASNAVPGLIQIYHDNYSYHSRYSAMVVLTYLGPASRAAIPIFLAESANTNVALRNFAITGLGSAHAQPEHILPVLLNALNDTNGAVRATAAGALEHYGTEAIPALPVLRDLISDPDHQVQRAVRRALEAIEWQAEIEPTK